MKDGEALAAAAARELREETGLALAAHDLGSPVAHGGGYADLGWVKGMFRDDYFFHRVGTHAVDVSGMERHETGTMLGHRWWPIDEITSTKEIIYPFGIGGFADRPPRRAHARAIGPASLAPLVRRSSHQSWPIRRAPKRTPVGGDEGTG